MTVSDANTRLQGVRAMTTMEGKAYGYLLRLFKAVAPQCEPLPDLMGVCTQVDNYIAGLIRDHAARLAEIKAAFDDIEKQAEIGNSSGASERAQRLRRAIKGEGLS